jgi:hypothetical protein
MPPAGACLCITSAYRESGKFLLAYVHDVPNFTAANLVVENSSDKSTWTVVTPSAKTDSLITFNVTAWENKWYRLRWGTGLVSNTAAPPDINHARSLVLGMPEPNITSGGTYWNIPFTQDFANFNPLGLKLFAEKDGAGIFSFTDIDVRGNVMQVLDPGLADESLWIKFYATYDGVTSNSVNTLSWILRPVETSDNPITAMTEQGQVTTVSIKFYNDLGSDFDATKLKMIYYDVTDWNGRTFESPNITVTDGEGIEKVATIDVGNMIYETSGYMGIKVRYVYDNYLIAELSTRVHA